MSIKTLVEADRGNKIKWLLFIVSFLSLFWEILLIRWIPCELPFLAFFRSLVLLACFLGMGLGCIAFARFRLNNVSLIFLFMTGVLIATVTIMLAGDDLRARGFGKDSGIYQQTESSIDKQDDRTVDFTIEFEGLKDKGELVIVGVFIYVALLFLPLGIVIARFFNDIDPLPAYLVNISGALSGATVFILISFFKLSPEYWYMIGLLPFFFLLPLKRGPQVIFWLMTIIISGSMWQLVHHPGYPVVWSPYQRVSCAFYYARLSGFPLGINDRHLVEAPVFVNYDYHQCMTDYSFTRNADPQEVNSVLLNLDRLFSRKFDTPASFYRRYTIPYLIKNKPAEVLIIGAGVGNEAAAALRAGVADIDAVEIDPGIVEIGYRYHPEDPYHDPRVNIICTDARSFLEQSDKQYDLIIKNVVDSHTQFASSAGLRLDSYIMTIEFFEQIRRHMKPDGLFAMEFSGYHWSLAWAQARIREILWRVFGYTINEEEPILRGAGGPMLLIKKGIPPPPAQHQKQIRVSTDDWPQFFLRKPMIPRAYLVLIVSVLLIALAGLAILSPRSLKRVDFHFLFLGAAFMMLEIKSITELSLVLGATWLVNSIVIVGVLLAIALANIVILRYKGFSYRIGYMIVFVSLALGFVFHPGLFLNLDFPLRAMAGIFRVGLPVFGAGLVFALSFRRADQPPVALGWNLLGAMIGGLGEYLSLITGVRLLGLVIIAFYLLSLLTLRRMSYEPQVP